MSTIGKRIQISRRAVEEAGWDALEAAKADGKEAWIIAVWCDGAITSGDRDLHEDDQSWMAYGCDTVCRCSLSKKKFADNFRHLEDDMEWFGIEVID